jgi:hypothetical protein
MTEPAKPHLPLESLPYSLAKTAACEAEKAAVVPAPVPPESVTHCEESRAWPAPTFVRVAKETPSSARAEATRMQWPTQRASSPWTSWA